MSDSVLEMQHFTKVFKVVATMPGEEVFTTKTQSRCAL